MEESTTAPVAKPPICVEDKNPEPVIKKTLSIATITEDDSAIATSVEVSVSATAVAANEPRRSNGDDVAAAASITKLPHYVPPSPSDREEDIYGQEIRSGQNFNKYSAIPVRVTGDNVPPPIGDDFTTDNAEQYLNIALLRNVRKSGYTTATPIQRYGIGAVLAGRDVMGCAQTGSGKTATFLLGILQKLLVEEPRPLADGRPQALIVTPTRELAVQLFMEARKFAYGTHLRSTVLYGGTATGPMLLQLRVSVCIAADSDSSHRLIDSISIYRRAVTCWSPHPVDCSTSSTTTG